MRGSRCNIYPASVVNWDWPDQWGSKATSSGQFKVGRSGWRGGIKEVCQVAVGLLCVVCLSRFSFSVCRRGFQAVLRIRPSSLFMLAISAVVWAVPG